jgi:hypothetical protein
MDRRSGGRRKKARVPKLADSGTGLGWMAKRRTGGQGPARAVVPQKESNSTPNERSAF